MTEDSQLHDQSCPEMLGLPYRGVNFENRTQSHMQKILICLCHIWNP